VSGPATLWASRGGSRNRPSYIPYTNSVPPTMTTSYEPYDAIAVQRTGVADRAEESGVARGRRWVWCLIHPLSAGQRGHPTRPPRTRRTHTPCPEQRRHHMNHRMPEQYRAHDWRTEWRSVEWRGGWGVCGGGCCVSDPGHSWGGTCQTPVRTNQRRPRDADNEAGTTVPRRCITRWAARVMLSWAGGTSGSSVHYNFALSTLLNSCCTSSSLSALCNLQFGEIADANLPTSTYNTTHKRQKKTHSGGCIDCSIHQCLHFSFIVITTHK
jgi:hypothetical protein